MCINLRSRSHRASLDSLSDQTVELGDQTKVCRLFVRSDTVTEIKTLSKIQSVGIITFQMVVEGELIQWRINKDRIKKSFGLFYMLSIQQGYSDITITEDQHIIRLDPDIVSLKEMNIINGYFEKGIIELDEHPDIDIYLRYRFLLGNILRMEDLRKDPLLEDDEEEEEEEQDELSDSELNPWYDDYPYSDEDDNCGNDFDDDFDDDD